MAQAFQRSANVAARASILGLPLVLGAFAAIGASLYTSPIVTQVNIAKSQPIPFSHQRHVGGNGIDCRYCHTTVEKSNFAGIPPTETCMTCHSQVLSDAPLLEPVRESWKEDKPIEWTRIYDVPDFVYFDHSIHVAKGVGCTTCHGEIDEMPLTYKANTLHMSWCLQCHKNPERFLRPQEEVFNVDWEPPHNQTELGLELVKQYNVKTEQLTNCSVCHR